MIQKIRNSRYCKGFAVFLAINFIADFIAPKGALALTSGPSQPEFQSFTPIGTSDMVDLSSGDFSYNIPLLDVGGYPINIAYNSGIGMDQEASWVGLGWNLSVGQISRNVRGIPDDFKGDKIKYTNYMKPNFTVGAAFAIDGNLAGFPLVSANGGIEIMYNNYSGAHISHTFGAGITNKGQTASFGINVKSSKDGLNINPSLSLSRTMAVGDKSDTKLGLNFGLPMNSRMGVQGFSYGINLSNQFAKSDLKNKANKQIGGGSGNDKMGSVSAGSSISFVPNTHTPSIETSMENYNFTFNAAIGSELFLGEAQGQISAWGTVQKVSKKDKQGRLKKAFGYDNNHAALKEDVRDLNREKDGAITKNTTNLAVTNQTYDQYNISGQGIGGMFRPYRSQLGYVTDARRTNFGMGGSLGLEFGAGNLIHIGFDVELSSTFGESGLWKQGNNSLNHLNEDYSNNRIDYEQVYYKNFGEIAADNEHQSLFTDLGEYNPMRLKMNGGEFNRGLDATYEVKSGSAANSYVNNSFNSSFKRDYRLKRNQAIRAVKHSEANQNAIGVANQNAKDWHNSEFEVVRGDGARYVYAEPLYNKEKKEVTFSVGTFSNMGTPNDGDLETGLVSYDAGVDNKIENGNGDEYFNSVETPEYAHTYLLSAILSTDYQDIDGNGPSDNDLGTYTKFTYGDATDYGWRTPFQANKANFNKGLNAQNRDDKATYTYGVKEEKYLQQIETKTHIAIFHYSNRNDAKGALGENGGIGASKKRLDRIELYSKGEYFDENGAVNPNPTPIKEVNFVYDYSLCVGVDNNPTSGEGKLTLKEVYFTYRNSKMGRYSGYKFNYGNNPQYDLTANDVWGNYKPQGTDVFNSEFPYVNQEKTGADANAAAWSLESIELPSGGEINVHYESDDYQYVQDKRAMQMYKVLGAGDSDNPNNTLGSSSYYKNEYLFTGPSAFEVNDYLYLECDEVYQSINDEADFKQEVINSLAGQKIMFRFLLNMSTWGYEGSMGENHFEWVTGYMDIDPNSVVLRAHPDNTNHPNEVIAVVKVPKVSQKNKISATTNVHPISKAGWQFGRKYLNGFVYGESGVDPGADPENIIAQLLGSQLFNNLIEAFQGPNGALKRKMCAGRFKSGKAWLRLGMSGDSKLGGGARVSKIEMTSNWASMLVDQFPGINTLPYQNEVYGQDYKYILENGGSSGVATYEPVGCKENPLVQPHSVDDFRLLAPDEDNFVEMPFGESFYPNPQVTYSRVTVTNLEKDVYTSHKTGKVVHEFYTTKDFPVIVDQTGINPKEDKTGILTSLLPIKTHLEYLTATQGYVIHLNDMNGKQKKQMVYAEGNDNPISGVEYNYKTSNQFGGSFSNLLSNNNGRLDNTVTVINEDGTIQDQMIGVEYDVVNDFRQNKSTTHTIGVGTNVGTFLAGFLPIGVVLPLPKYELNRDQVRLSSTTKVIQTFGILEETVAYDLGAAVATKNLAWDARTGEVLLTETVNEYNDKYYTMNYPAHWYYKGMSQASRNLNLRHYFEEVPGNGNLFRLEGNHNEEEYLVNGDEMIINASGNVTKLWVDNVTSSSFNLLLEDGQLFDIADFGGVTEYAFAIVRSGRRNLQTTNMQSVTSRVNPILDASGNYRNLEESTLSYVFGATDNQKVVNASVVEFSDDWPLPCECEFETDPEDIINPYKWNAKGVWRALRSHAYLVARDGYSTISSTDNNREYGFFREFKPFYHRNTANNAWEKINEGTTDPLDHWTWTSEVTNYSPYGFELENKDALNRYSAAQYGYNNMFPLAVGANTTYNEIGFDGFEDYEYNECVYETHFGFHEEDRDDSRSHTGKWSIKVGAGTSKSITKVLSNN